MAEKDCWPWLDGYSRNVPWPWTNVRTKLNRSLEISSRNSALRKQAREEPDRVYRDGQNWVWVDPDGIHRLICPCCYDGGGAHLTRFQIPGSDDVFYWCNECNASWPVTGFCWDDAPYDRDSPTLDSVMAERRLTDDDLVCLDPMA